MAYSLTFASGETLVLESRITFATLDFLATAIDNIYLTTLYVPISSGTPTCSTRIKAEKRHLKRCATTLEHRLNMHTDAINKNTAGASPSILLVVIGHQPPSVHDLLENDLSHGSTEANSNTDESPERACFMATPPQNVKGRGLMCGGTARIIPT
jgi:hypothetical protein